MRVKNGNNIQDKAIIITTHYSSTAFIQHLEEFLRSIRIKKLLYISHPLHPERDKDLSFYRLFQEKKVVKTAKFSIFKNNGIVTYLKDSLLNVFWCVKNGKGWNLYIGADNLNTISGILLKKLGFVEKVVFYTVDFVPYRFKNRLLNDFYH